MPLYEYRCARCGHTLEVLQRFSDAPLKRCPQCRGKLEKLISSPAIQFKGTGWYVTDYARKGDGRKDSEGDGKKGSEDVKSSSQTTNITSH